MTERKPTNRSCAKIYRYIVFVKGEGGGREKGALESAVRCKAAPSWEVLHHQMQSTLASILCATDPDTCARGSQSTALGFPKPVALARGSSLFRPQLSVLFRWTSTLQQLFVSFYFCARKEQLSAIDTERNVPPTSLNLPWNAPTKAPVSPGYGASALYSS